MDPSRTPEPDVTPEQHRDAKRARTMDCDGDMTPLSALTPCEVGPWIATRNGWSRKLNGESTWFIEPDSAVAVNERTDDNEGAVDVEEVVDTPCFDLVPFTGEHAYDLESEMAAEMEEWECSIAHEDAAMLTQFDDTLDENSDDEDSEKEDAVVREQAVEEEDILPLPVPFF